MNKTAIYSTAIASTIAVLAVFAFSSNEVDAIKPPTEPASICPAENVQHWVNLAVTINNPLQHATEPTIVVERIFVPVKTSGSEILSVTLVTTKVAERLTELGFTQSDGDPVSIFDIGSVNFDADFAHYSTICAQN